MPLIKAFKRLILNVFKLWLQQGKILANISQFNCFSKFRHATATHISKVYSRAQELKSWSFFCHSCSTSLDIELKLSNIVIHTLVLGVPSVFYLNLYSLYRLGYKIVSTLSTTLVVYSNACHASFAAYIVGQLSAKGAKAMNIFVLYLLYINSTNFSWHNYFNLQLQISFSSSLFVKKQGYVTSVLYI